MNRFKTTNDSTTIPISPANVFREKSVEWGVAIESAEFAKMMDQEDQFSSYREQFSFPKKIELPKSM